MYEHNLKILKKYHPDLYNILIKDNEKSNINVVFNGNLLKINNLTCFSKYNPEKEAEKLIHKFEEEKSNIKDVVVFGFSNPFVIKKISEKYDTVIYIPDIYAFEEVLKFIDFSEIFKNVKKIVNNKKDIPFKEYEIFTLPVEKKIYENKLEEFYTDDKNYLKVLLVNPIYGGSLPIANYIAKNLNKFNIKLKVINSEIFHECLNYIKNIFSIKKFEINTTNSFLNFISDLILNEIEEFKPDVLFGVAQSPISVKVLNYCQSKGILKIFWFMEDYKLFTYWKEFAPFYDFYFTIQKDEFFNELKKIGVKNYYYLPVAAEPSVHKPLELTEEEKKYYGSTISFVGAGYYNRRMFFRNLIDYDFKIWGSDWEGEVILKDLIQENGRRITPEEYVKIFNASLINLNLHSSTYLPGVDLNGDFVNPRTFEIAATNSIQIVDRRKYLPELFKENEEILVFSDINELKNIINDIIKNPSKYREVAERGYKRVINEHTYEHRIIEIFNKIGFQLEKPSFLDGTPDFYFFKFNSIEEIADYINKKEKINDDEKIFLLMNELKKMYLK